MRKLLALVLVLIFASIAHANIDDTTRTILTSQELTISQEIQGGARIRYSNDRQQIAEIEGTIDFFPINTDRQTVLSSSFSPEDYTKNDTHIHFSWRRVQESEVDFNAQFTIQTENTYTEIQEKIRFPITQELSPEIQEYLKFTQNMDISDDITRTASLVASGKDDLFDVAQAVAYWVHTNVEYDLSTLGQDAENPASQIILDRRGVCNELTILYVSMMRSLGIPARYVTGIAYTDSTLFDEQWVPHAWAEVYFPGYGWVPFDLTYVQFGFVDASHIKFSDSKDVGSIATNFQWRGRNIQDVIVQLKETQFEMAITDSRGLVSPKFSLDVDVGFSGANIGSYNVLKIHAKNNADHYVSSLVYISTPREVTTAERRIPIFLRPHEERTFYVLLETSNQLSTRYTYEMPIVIYTNYGHERETSYTVSSSQSHVTINQVNAYLERNQPAQQQTEQIRIDCDPRLNRGVYTPIQCIVQNTGNVYMVDTEICIEIQADVTTECITADIPIHQAQSFQTQIRSDEPGQIEATIAIKREGTIARKRVSFIMTEDPALAIVAATFPEEVEPSDRFEATISVEQRSIAQPSNTVVYVETPRRTLSWNIPDVSGQVDLQIPLHAHYFNSGDTRVLLVWEDAEGNTFSTERVVAVSVGDRTLLEKVQRWFFLLFR